MVSKQSVINWGLSAVLLMPHYQILFAKFMNDLECYLHIGICTFSDF